MIDGDRDSGVGLAEVVAAFSLATDLGLGQPMEHVLRSWAIATRLGEHMGVENGVDAAIELARSRRGKHFDPEVVDAFCAVAADLFAGLDDAVDWPAVIGQDPRLQRRLTEAGLDAALEALADFTDLRSRSRTGHSRAVASLAARAGELCGLPEGEVVNLRRAAWVHDVGMHGVPATILEKPGPLTSTESERMRMHSYYTERTLARPAALARIGAVASLASERLDGSGYHRGVSGSAIPVTGRILAAACAYQAMTEPRAYRPARTPKEAAGELRHEVRSGRLAADAVDAVLAAAGQRRPPSDRQARPDSHPERSRSSR